VQTRAEVAVGDVTYPGAGSPFMRLLIEIGVAQLVAAELWQRRVAADDPALVGE
jgi:hypothetical protein